MASGSCSPAVPDKVYDRSKAFGPATFISQFSLARDPAIITRHSPCLSLNACSIRALISRHNSASPRFCNSIVTAIACNFNGVPVGDVPQGASRESFRRSSACKLKRGAECADASRRLKCSVRVRVHSRKRELRLFLSIAVDVGSDHQLQQMKKLRHWLCSICLLLRESHQRGCMYRRSP